MAKKPRKTVLVRIEKEQYLKLKLEAYRKGMTISKLLDEKLKK